MYMMNSEERTISYIHPLNQNSNTNAKFDKLYWEKVTWYSNVNRVSEVQDNNVKTVQSEEIPARKFQCTLRNYENSSDARNN